MASTIQEISGRTGQHVALTNSFIYYRFFIYTACLLSSCDISSLQVIISGAAAVVDLDYVL